MTNFEHNPSAEEQEQIDNLIVEIQQLREKLERIKSKSPEMLSIIEVTSEDTDI